MLAPSKSKCWITPWEKRFNWDMIEYNLISLELLSISELENRRKVNVHLGIRFDLAVLLIRTPSNCLKKKVKQSDNKKPDKEKR